MEHLLHRRLLCVVARQEVVVELGQGTVASGHACHFRFDGGAARIHLGPGRAFGFRIIGRPEDIGQLAIVFLEGQLPARFIGELVPGLSAGQDFNRFPYFRLLRPQLFAGDQRLFVHGAVPEVRDDVRDWCAREQHQGEFASLGLGQAPDGLGGHMS